MTTVYLSLGSNLGDRAANLRHAVRRLPRPGLVVEAVSSVYETEPVGDTPEPVPPYLNCVVLAATDLLPTDLLDWTQAVEKAGGRTPSFRWGPRAIDVDILLYDAETLACDRLEIPHPRLCERAFVLVPLAELAPELALPDGSTVHRWLDEPSVGSQRLVKIGPLDADDGAA